MKVQKWANYSTPSPSVDPFTVTGNRHRPPPNPRSTGEGSGTLWSMSSLMEYLPESPSPICSSPPASSMDFSTDFFTPKHQNGLGGVIIGKLPEPRSEVRSSVPTDRRELLSFLSGECNSPTRRSLSTLYESTLTTMDQQDLNPCPGNSRKSQKHHYQELICEGSSSQDTPIHEEFHSRLTRPKPYQEFLEEVQTQNQGAEMEAWKKVKQLKLQNKLRRKEAEINNWEMEQKSKARAEMELMEKKVEKKRAKALKKMQEKIIQANKTAEKERAIERRAVLKKMARVATLSDKSQATKCMICLKLQKLC